MGLLSPRGFMTRKVYIPFTRIPAGSMLELPGRGSTYVTDTPGPSSDSPTIVLLHAVGCTGLLTWFPAIEPLSRRFRVITMDQRWHGRGIQSDDFSLYDCADDVAALIDVLEVDAPIVAGYSMGSIVAQRVWRQHGEKIGGLILCATTDRFRSSIPELLFHQSMETAMFATRSVSRSRTAVVAARATAKALDLEPDDIYEWAIQEFRTTSPWAVGQAVATLGRHHSRPWLSKIDVPTAVVVTLKDRVLPPDNQIALARRIPGATIHELKGGHAACVLESERFVPALLEAAATVNARRRDFPRRDKVSSQRSSSASA